MRRKRETCRRAMTHSKTGMETPKINQIASRPRVRSCPAMPFRPRENLCSRFKSRSAKRSRLTPRRRRMQAKLTIHRPLRSKRTRPGRRQFLGMTCRSEWLHPLPILLRGTQSQASQAKVERTALGIILTSPSVTWILGNQAAIQHPYS